MKNLVVATVVVAALVVVSTVRAQTETPPSSSESHPIDDGVPRQHSFADSEADEARNRNLASQYHTAVEVLWAAGCPKGDSIPRRVTTKCPAIGGTTITVRGRNFGPSSMQIYLVPAISKKLATSVDTNKKPYPEHKPCLRVQHSHMLPSLLVTCELPPAPAGSAWDLVAAHQNGISGVLRDAITYFDPNGASGEGSREQNAMKALDSLDWEELGIGGLGPQFRELFRRAFGSRLDSVSQVTKNLNIRHVKGVILHGLPGTGKTLVARKIADLLGARNVQLVNGPEIISKFVGESEKNLRRLFKNAETDYEKHGDKAELHVIIMDEIDAIMKQRGSGDDSAARAMYDGVTMQMLAYMDGVKTQNNVLIIGMTNRIEALDQALLRPGRFEVQLRLPLPDAKGREQIFHIHTKELRKHNYLAPSVDFKALAQDTSSLSGADIAGAVRSAQSFAIARYHNQVSRYDDLVASASAIGGEPPKPPVFLVQKGDILRGVREVLQTKSAASNTAPFLEKGYVLHSKAISQTITKMEGLAKSVQDAPAARSVKILLEGKPETGLTATAALVARRAQFPFVHIITPDSLSGLTTAQKIERIRFAFDGAAQSPASCIILDSIDVILEYAPGRSRMNDQIQLELLNLMRRQSNRGVTSHESSVTISSHSDDGPNHKARDGRLLVIATSASMEAARLLSSGNSVFDAVEHLNGLSKEETARVLHEYELFATKEEAISASARVPLLIPIKRLLFLMEMTLLRAFGESVTEMPSPLLLPTNNFVPNYMDDVEQREEDVVGGSHRKQENVKQQPTASSQKQRPPGGRLSSEDINRLAQEANNKRLNLQQQNPSDEASSGSTPAGDASKPAASATLDQEEKNEKKEKKKKRPHVSVDAFFATLREFDLHDNVLSLGEDDDAAGFLGERIYDGAVVW